MMIKKMTIGSLWVYAFAFIFTLICILPIIHILAISLNDALDARKGGIFLIPRIWSMANYNMVFKHEKLLNSYSITIFRTVVGMVLAVLLNSTYAYALSKKKLLFRKFLTWWTIIPMYFGAGLIPLFLVLHNLKITNTIWVFIIPYIYVPFYIIVFRTFYRTIPDSIEESAKMDGASDFLIYTKFIFPLSAPVMATIALFSGVSQWNDWFVGTAFVFTDKLWPVQTLLMYILKSADPRELTQADMFSDFMRGITGVTVTPESLKMSMIIICTLPIVLIYPFLQKYFIKGLSVGSIKE